MPEKPFGQKRHGSTVLIAAALILAGCAYQPIRHATPPTFHVDEVTHEARYWQGPETGAASGGPFDPGNRNLTYGPARAPVRHQPTAEK
jgi:hypothetical protein